MCEYGKRVNETERAIAVNQRRAWRVYLELGKREVLLAPIDHLRVIIRAVQPSSLQAVEVPYHAPAAAAEIQDSSQIINIQAPLLQKRGNRVGAEPPDV